MASLMEEIDAFIEDNSFDDEASGILRDLEPHLQQELLDRGPLTDARNPSAVVLSRVRQLKATDKKAGGKGGAQTNRGAGASGNNVQRQIADFVQENDLDERAEQVLTETDDRILKELFARGPLTDVRNASAVVLSRLREIKRDLDRETVAPPRTRPEVRGTRSGNAGSLKREIARFVRENDLDDRAEQCLMETEGDVVRELLHRGPLTDVRNPSAVVLSRLREIKREGVDKRPSGRDDNRGGRSGNDQGSRLGPGGKGTKDDFMEFAWKMWEEFNKGKGPTSRRGPY